MCGRSYSTISEEELEARYETDKLKQDPLGLGYDWRFNYNTAPTHVMPVIVKGASKNEVRFMRWGLVPAWAESVKDAAKYSLINARAEEILTKKSYSEAFKKRRCIVPLSGFYEWRRGPSVSRPSRKESSQGMLPLDGLDLPALTSPAQTKTPFAIRLKGDEIMSVAGVWEHWVDKKSGEVVDSFAIITTSSNEIMSSIHDRMPVILRKEDEGEWLDPSNQDVLKLKELLRPCPTEWLEMYEVSNLVNSPKNNVPEVLEKVN